MQDDRSLSKGSRNAPVPEAPPSGLGARGEGITRAVLRRGLKVRRSVSRKWQCVLCHEFKTRFCKGCERCVHCCRVWELCSGR